MVGATTGTVMYDTRLKKVLGGMDRMRRLLFLIQYAKAYGRTWEHYFDAKGRARRRKRA